MEKCDEVHNNNGDFYLADYRSYDARLGRWLSQDPIVKPWESPYAGFANNPIYYVDPSGLNPAIASGPPETGKVGDVYSETDESGKTWTWNYTEKDGWVGDFGGKELNVVVITPMTFWDYAVRGMKKTWGGIVQWLKDFDRKQDEADDNHTGRKPVKTAFHGFQQAGDGKTKNNHMEGLPDFTDNNYTPGSTAAGISYHPTFDTKKIDDLDDLLDSDGADGMIKEIGGGIASLMDWGDQTNTYLQKNTAKDVQNQNTTTTRPPDMLVPDGHGTYTYKVYNTATGEYEIYEENVDDYRAGGIRHQNEGNSNFKDLSR